TMCKVLIFGCIAAVILMTAAYGAPLKKTKLSPAQKEERLKASIIDLALLKDIDNNFLDFYTPNDKQECNHTTLACFLKELKVLKQDVEEKDKQHVINIEKNLEDFKVGNLLQDPDFSNPTCKKCEANEKKKFAEFHQEMTSFLQSMQK
ncbi:IL15 protein, partial [Promerops cafer]|nr:IL15 protein [Promerops cafer]